ncbi:MAG: sensor histidine kinase [Rhodopirellula sp. JB044]|uniref:sensor histidine kinase n=1 Tax=Rhodopirellula sp. JB044 TaxID=3342844 RepID=UPI00370ACB43
MRDDRLAWPIVLLLLIVLVPSLGMMWMMREAVENERLASDQRLREAYVIQLQSGKKSIRDRWRSQMEHRIAFLSTDTPAIVFERLVSSGSVDGALIRDDDGKILYPTVSVLGQNSGEIRDPRWRRAQRLEFADQDYAAARDLYAELSEEQLGDEDRCRAMQSRIRCSLKLDETDIALTLLEELSEDDEALDGRGRSFAATAQLQMLELLDSGTEPYRSMMTRLANRLNDYSRPMVSTQRQFLMSRLLDMDSSWLTFPTRDAELLSSEMMSNFDEASVQNELKPTSDQDLWARMSMAGRIVELHRVANLKHRLIALTENVPLTSGIEFVISQPNEQSTGMMDVSLGADFGGMRLGLAESSPNREDAKASQNRVFHAWIAWLVVFVTCVLAWLLSRTLKRRLRLARLKNDLVATVSHELKTPLSSIRLLVDTLLNSDHDLAHEHSRERDREYLELISHENARLTRLIDNFLTFSRIDQGRLDFEFESIDLQDVVGQAVAVFREHWKEVDSCLRIQHNSPATLMGDKDALITVVVNLLENAWKYSDDNRQITLVTGVDGASAVLKVGDNGIGLNARAKRRVFDRFFQVDQRVARSRGGCGLGLSIVSAIVESHGGAIGVESELGVGSTFIVTLPVVDKQDTDEREVTEHVDEHVRCVDITAREGMH